MAQPGQRLAEAAGRHAGHLREVVGDEVGAGQSDVAAELYQTRLRLGIELADAAGELRIRYDQLLALEEGRFDDLPGPTYVIGFLRSYAGYLGLDAGEVVRRFKAEASDFDARQDLAFPSSYEEGRVPTGALIALALTLVVAAYTGWYYVASVDRVAIERVPEVPERLVAAVTPEAGALSIDAVVESLPERPVLSADAAPAEDGEETVSAPSEAQPVIAAVETDAPGSEPVAPGAVEAAAPEREDADALVATTERAAAEPEIDVAAPEPEDATAPVATTEPVVVEPEVDVSAPEPEDAAAPVATTEPVAAEPELDVAAPEPKVEVAPLEVSEPTAPEPKIAVAPIAVAAPAAPEPSEVSAEPESELIAPEPAQTAPAESAPAAPEPAEPEPLQTASLAPEVPAPVVEATGYRPREFGRANAGSTIQLRAQLESWVQVTGAGNELLLTRILRPGDVYHVPDRPGLVLMTGNAGGLEIMVGGTVAPALGPVGAVRRRVALDPERLLAGTAVD